jgi:hypothetical protein
VLGDAVVVVPARFHRIEGRIVGIVDGCAYLPLGTPETVRQARE